MSSSVRSVVLLAAIAVVAGSFYRAPENTSNGENPSGVAPGDQLIIEDGTTEDGTQGGQAIVGGSSGTEGTEGRVITGQATGADGGADDGAAGSGGLECTPGRNGGATDTGVTANRIGLASTMVTSGPGSTFLNQSPFGMQALVAKVNKAEGICGRSLDLKLVNDNWEAQRGHGILRNFMADDSIFALPVVPSSEGLAAASRDVADTGIPVVGTDGMLIEQYRNDWIWPVATATVSQMRIMVDYAASKAKNKIMNADSFAIVYDTRYKFGVEGRDAYETYIKDKGLDFVHAEGVEPNQPGYGPQIKNLNDECGDSGCDVVVMLLDPGTATTWIKGDENFASRARFRFGAQPLFTDKFGQDCGQRCDGMLVWTGYVPPLEGNAGLPGIKEYVQDVRNVQPSADVSNQFLEGAYLGMSVFVEALQKTGPNLTREGLAQTMNTMTHTSDLASELSWSDGKFANTKAQAWEIKSGSGSFDGFRYTRSGWIDDTEA